MNYPRYPTYKNSNVTWLGEIPEGWKLQSGRSTFMQTRIKSDVKDEQLSATQKYGVIPQDQFMELEDQKVMLALKGTESFKHVDVDDFVISLRSFEGGIEHCHYNGCVSPAYTILKSRIEVIPDFFAYIFKSQLFIQVIQSVSEGIRDGKTITYEQFSKLTLPIPPLSDQSDIAKFLNGAVSKVDLLISKQQQLMELLKEKRQAIITHAVTKGHDPNVQMKDSGIEWIGEIPENWSISKLKWVCQIKYGNSLAAEDRIPGDYPVFGSNGVIDYNSQTNTLAPVIILGRKGSYGKVTFSEIAGFAIDTTFFIDIKCSNSNLNWLYYALRTLNLDENSQDTGVPGLSREVALEKLIPVPSKEEQKQISRFLNSTTTQYEVLISKQQNMIDLLKEYRESLVSHAVTGKIDLRRSTIDHLITNP